MSGFVTNELSTFSTVDEGNVSGSILLVFNLFLNKQFSLLVVACQGFRTMEDCQGSVEIAMDSNASFYVVATVVVGWDL